MQIAREHAPLRYGDIGYRRGTYLGEPARRRPQALAHACLAYTFANGNVEKPTALVMNGSLGLGARLRLTTPRSRFRVLAEAQYHGEGIYQTVLSEIRATETVDGTTYQVGKKVDFGAFDLLHGPRLQLVGVF